MFLKSFGTRKTPTQDCLLTLANLRSVCLYRIAHSHFALTSVLNVLCPLVSPYFDTTLYIYGSADLHKLKLWERQQECVIKRHAKKTQEVVELHSFLTSVLVVDDWSASHPGRFSSQRKSCGYSLDKRWDGSERHSERFDDDRELCLCREIETLSLSHCIVPLSEHRLQSVARFRGWL